MKKLLFIFLFAGIVSGATAHGAGHAHRSPAHHHGGHHHHHHTKLTSREEQKPVH